MTNRKAAVARDLINKGPFLVDGMFGLAREKVQLLFAMTLDIPGKGIPLEFLYCRRRSIHSPSKPGVTLKTWPRYLALA